MARRLGEGALNQETPDKMERLDRHFIVDFHNGSCNHVIPSQFLGCMSCIFCTFVQNYYLCMFVYYVMLSLQFGLSLQTEIWCPNCLNHQHGNQ